MSDISVKWVWLILLSLLISARAVAQDPRFIYIQTENKQPFYVKMDKKVLSSSASGYIIIPKLTGSVYQLTIGFPKNEWPELNFTVNMKDTNAGFLLRDRGEDGWGIINLLTERSVNAEKKTLLKNKVTIQSTNDEFARVLAEVVNDPSIAEVTAVKKEAETTLNNVETKVAETPVSTKEVKPVLENKKDSGEQVAKIRISKLNQENTSEGLLVTYIDNAVGSEDTIKIFMPASNNKPVKKSKSEKQADEPVSINTGAKKTIQKNDDSRFIDMELQNPNIKVDTGLLKKDDFIITEKKAAARENLSDKQDTNSIAVNTGKEMINSDCKSSATQSDFLELRKHMAAETNEKDMLKIAAKQFSKTCFTTEQVKNLGVLFINEEERYKFFVAAYPFVSDSHNFGTLEDQLSEDHLKIRFKALLNH